MSFHFKQFSITHQTHGLKVNTDGCLLGALANTEHPKNCLDIGTGTGVIALMLAQKFPDAFVTAVEILPAIHAQAQQNISFSPFAQRIHCLNADIQTFSNDGLFDLITCNPPYFTNHLKSTDHARNSALHTEGLTTELLAQKINLLLSAKGHAWVIYPPAEALLFEKQIEAQQLQIHQRIAVFNKPGHHYRTVLSIGKENAEIKQSELLIADEAGQRSAAFSQLMFDFYL